MPLNAGGILNPNGLWILSVKFAWHHGEGKMMLHYAPQSDIKDKMHLHFYLRDHHLGNTVVTFDDRDYDGMISEIEEGTQSEVLGRYHYYSFGMQWNHAWVGSDITGYWKQRLRYNGKELHSNSGLLDYGFRYYMPEIGRFTGVDPLADAPANLAYSTYAYVWNNPLSFIDPDGLAPDCEGCPDPAKHKEGDVVNPFGGMDIKLTNGEWVGDGGNISQVEIIGYNTSDGLPPRFGTYMGLSGQLNKQKSAGAAFSDAMQNLVTFTSTTFAPIGALTSMIMRALTMLKFANAAKTSTSGNSKIIDARKQGKHIVGHNN